MTDNTMTLLLDQIQASTDGDFLRAIAAHTLQRLMEFEVDSLIGAGRHERSDERTTYRNGHRDRQLETRLGTLRSLTRYRPARFVRLGATVDGYRQVFNIV